MRSFFSLVLLSLCLHLAGQSNQADIDEGMNLFKQRKYEEAYQKIKASMGKSDKKNAPSFAALAWVINEAQQYQWYPPYRDKDTWLREMEYNAKLAVKYDKDNVLGHLMLAANFFEKKDYTKSGEELDIVEKLDPGNYYLAFCRGNICFVASKYDCAVEEYQKSIARKPDYPSTYWNLVQIYLNQKKYEDALVTCKKYVSLNPAMANSLVWVYYRLAGASASMKNYLDSAYEYITRIITPYSASNADDYYQKYKPLTQSYFNFCGQPTLDLINACLENKIDTAIAALKNGADPNALYDDYKFKRFKTHPLLYAARTHSYTLLKALLDAGANPNIKDDVGRTALHFLGGYTEKPEEILPLANLLFNHKASLEIRDIAGQTPLASALTYGYEDYLKWLISHNADVNTKENNGFTPAITMARQTDNVLKLFIDHGANINDTVADGRGILDDILYEGDYAAIYLLEKAGINDKSKYNNPNYSDIKAFVAYLHSNVIGRPPAKLFDAIFDSDLKAFKAQLAGGKEKTLLNYLSVVTMEFKYAKPFYDALVAAGADPAAKRYSYYFGESISARDIFYPKAKAASRYADFDLYYGQRTDELQADMEYYGTRMINRNFSHTDRCDYIIQYAKVIVKIIQLCKEAGGDALLSADSRAAAQGFEKSQRDVLIRLQGRFYDEFECGGIFPKAD